MSISTTVKWFSDSHPTIEDAQKQYIYSLFNPAAVFELPGGGFVFAYIRDRDWPPHETAREVKRLVNYDMVSCCDPLMGIWKPYQAQEETQP